MFLHDNFQMLLDAIDPLLSDTDKFKQCAGAELLAGLLRGMYYRKVLLNCLPTLSYRLKALVFAIVAQIMGLDDVSFGGDLCPNKA
jgi:hypothetical protein